MLYQLLNRGVDPTYAFISCLEAVGIYHFVVTIYTFLVLEVWIQHFVVTLCFISVKMVMGMKNFVVAKQFAETIAN